MDDIIVLIKEVTFKDEIGNLIPVEEARQVFCTKKPVRSEEYFKASQQGLSQMMNFVTHPSNYNDEQILEYQGKRYGIYRTYQKSLDEFEIYASYKAGVNNV